MKGIDGLYFHEMVLLGLGVLLFIVLLVILIIFTIQKRKLKELTIFFMVSIIMMGYPSIQKIAYDKGVLTIEKSTEGLISDSSDNILDDKLENQIKRIEKRPTKNPETLINLSKVEAILGDTLEADRLVNKALDLSPDLTEARDLKTQFNTTQVQVEKIISEIERNPGNNSAREELEIKISEINTDPDANASEMITAAKAYAILGDTSRAISFTDSAITKNTKNSEAVKLKKKLAGKKFID